MSYIDSFRDSFGKRRIFWLNLSGSFAIGLDRAFPITNVGCLDDGLEYPLVEQRSGVAFCSHERSTAERVVTHDPASDDVAGLLGPRIEAIVRSAPSDDWWLVCPRKSPALEAIAQRRGCSYVGPRPDLCDWLNHKANFFQGCNKLGLAFPPGRWLRAFQTRHSELHGEFGDKYVLQQPRGTTGLGTRIVSSEADFARAGAALGDDDLWAAPYLGNLSLNLNAIAMETAAAVSYPSVQLVGFDMLGQTPGGYCGNDFSAVAALPPSMIEEAIEKTRRLGEWLATLGYRGIYGVDFVVEAATGCLYAVDLNPRWQGSTVLEIQAMLREGRLPLAAADIAYGTGALSEQEVMDLADDFRLPISGSQLLPYVPQGVTHRVARDIRPGVYRIADKLEFLREGLEIADCTTDEEALLTGGIVKRGTMMYPGSRPLRLFSPRSAIHLNTCRPLPWAQRAAEQLYRLLGLTPPSLADG